ncbi:phosphoribosyltransferase [Leifsonia sp. McL0607]|uniref:phosphoribosyltransferase n=1 Tax=Leifsonia sp. McL0607 TaxID=3415672 RepID=UPI003CFAE280
MFADRAEAGRLLAERLLPLSAEHPVVLGLPRGGAPVAFEVAAALRAPLDVLVVRKLGVPYQPELAMGAIGENGVRVVDDDVMRMSGVHPQELDDVERLERAELERRVARYRAGRRSVSLAGRTAVIVDDGIATGSTARAGRGRSARNGSCSPRRSDRPTSGSVSVRTPTR